MPSLILKSMMQELEGERGMFKKMFTLEYEAKYQQICAKHTINQNGSSAEAASAISSSSSKGVPPNPLSGLLGEYCSDSDSDQDTPSTLDGKVSDFLKEIQTIAPPPHVTADNSTSRIPGPVQVTESQSQLHPAMAWQECYDESSGYVYYWNMVTNEVTWEMPVEYQTPTASGGLDPEAWALHQSVVVAPSIPPSHYPHGPVPGVKLRNEASTSKAGLHRSVRTNHVEASTSKATLNNKRKKNGASDSEDERIEMITSYGPGSDESEEEVPATVMQLKKKKTVNTPSKAALVDSSELSVDSSSPHMIGPLEETIMSGESSLLSNDVADLGPPGDEDQFSVPDSSDEPSLANLTAMLRVRRLKMAALEQMDDLIGSASPMPVVEAGESDTESGEPDEGAILSKIRTKARILRELGGEIPEEIRELIEPVSTDVAEDIIAQIEREQPPDYRTSTENSPRSSSFALIAGYGDDSDTDEKISSLSPKKSKTLKKKKVTNETAVIGPSSLFPIDEYEALASSSKESTDMTSKLSDPPVLVLDVEGNDEKEPEESLAQPEAPQAPVAPLFPLATTEKESIIENANVPTTSRMLESTNLPDSTTSNKTFKRKKRLEIGPLQAPVKPLDHAVPSTSRENAAPTSHHVSYNLDPAGAERRGFGFQAPDIPPTPVEIPTPEKSKVKTGMISFIKAETINLPPTETPSDDETAKVSDGREDTETRQRIDDMASLISEKVKFLGEGKDPVSPVQSMAIQIETLVSAWMAGFLSGVYLSDWLTTTGTELAGLEQAAAPNGWVCQWDREHKRYFYRNEASEEMRWEYPTAPELPQEEEGDQGGEEMDLCTTPPLPSSPPPPPIEEFPMTPPPPPRISEELSPPPPPKISCSVENEVAKPPKSKITSSTSSKSKRRKIDEVSSTSSEVPKLAKVAVGVTSSEGPQQSSDLPFPPLPPLPPLPSKPPLPLSNSLLTDGEMPPLPSGPPPPPCKPPPPPPPPPVELPPLPPTSPPPIPQMTEHGEPLPPGVEPLELPFVVAKPAPGFRAPSYMSPHSPLPPDSTDINVPLMMTEEQMSGMVHPMGQYMMPGNYQTSVVSSSSHHLNGMSSMGMVQQIPMDYNSPYLTTMPEPHVIARSASKPSKTASLYAELDSFYSDIASLELTPAAPEPPQAPTQPPNMDLAQPSTSHHHHQPPTEPELPFTKPSADSKKKKKHKLTPGIALKKKGVSSLVAKWQQVQQEVRRDYKNLDDEDGVSSTHK